MRREVLGGGVHRPLPEPLWVRTGRAQYEGVQSWPQTRCAQYLEFACAAFGQGDGDQAAALALDQQSGTHVEEGFLGREQGAQRATGDLPVVAPEQTAGCAVGVENELVAGDDQAFVDEFEQREIDASLRPFGKVGHEGFGRGRRPGWASWNIHGRQVLERCSPTTASA